MNSWATEIQATEQGIIAHKHDWFNEICLYCMWENIVYYRSSVKNQQLFLFFYFAKIILIFQYKKRIFIWFEYINS